ncbi:MAG: DUF3396 domain-containing protein [Azoarcus sp.]|jgi:hypothetical protein|nr:DUF3396 domain-containing protein [Azoarcus sp.]
MIPSHSEQEGWAFRRDDHIHPALKKYIGLDVRTPVDFTMETKGVHNCIKCINWLAILGDAIPEELGGLAMVKSALEPECTLYPYPGGVMIQAGALHGLREQPVPSSETFGWQERSKEVDQPLRLIAC